jgi:hypothetical protein
VSVLALHSPLLRVVCVAHPNGCRRHASCSVAPTCGDDGAATEPLLHPTPRDVRGRRTPRQRRARRQLFLPGILPHPRYHPQLSAASAPSHALELRVVHELQVVQEDACTIPCLLPWLLTSARATQCGARVSPSYVASRHVCTVLSILIHGYRLSLLRLPHLFSGVGLMIYLAGFLFPEGRRPWTDGSVSGTARDACECAFAERLE